MSINRLNINHFLYIFFQILIAKYALHCNQFNKSASACL